MKQLLLILTVLPLLAYSQYQAKCFHPDLDAETLVIQNQMTLCENTEIKANIRSAITRFCVSGTSVLDNMEDSYIRIVLQDNFGYEYLVYENYPLLSDCQSTDFDNVAMETFALDNIIVNSIKIELHKAKLHLRSWNYSTRQSTVNIHEVEKMQRRSIANCLNANLKKKNMTWRAGFTDISLKSYEDKKAMFGGYCPELYGFDYYKGGIFVLPDDTKVQDSRKVKMSQGSNFVKAWDWRNRHGKCWVTNVKDQSTCGSCYAFSAASVVEAYVNLYYNRIIENNDLSEQELVSCDAGNDGCGGGTAYTSFEYIHNNGVVNEDCFPYVNFQASCTQKCLHPYERIYVENYGALADNLNAFHSLSEEAVDSLIKRKLFVSPISFGILPWHHIVNLIGYKTLSVGSSVYDGNSTDTDSILTISEEDSLLIGKTAWLIKNSWGSTWGDNGYGYVIANKHNLNLPHFVSGRITSLNYSDSDIVCEDADGDGYYFWGVGPKPDSCPSWIPDEPDGDDSNIYLGSLDYYGNLEVLPSGITIKTPITYSPTSSMPYRLGIVNGGALTITGATTLTGSSNVRVCEGGKLIIDGGALIDADITMVPGSQLILKNNGVIKMANGKDLEVPTGAIVNIECGQIL